MWNVPPLNLIFFLFSDKENFNFLLAEKACCFLFSGVCILFFLWEEGVAFATSRLPRNQIRPSKTSYKISPTIQTFLTLNVFAQSISILRPVCI